MATAMSTAIAFKAGHSWRHQQLGHHLGCNFKQHASGTGFSAGCGLCASTGFCDAMQYNVPRVILGTQSPVPVR
jgi:hypothetical protein